MGLNERYPDGIPSEIMSLTLWDDFRRAEESWCCRAVRKTKGEGLNHIALPTDSGFMFVRVYYCPRCGKKLQG